MNLDTAYRRALLCDLAYTDAATPIGPHYAVIGAEETRDGNDILIAFRGTGKWDSPLGLKEWFEDARLAPVKSTIWPGLVHSGAAAAVQECWTELLKAIPKPDLEKPRIIHLTGHSLGATMSIAAAWRFSAVPGYKVASVCAFAPFHFGDGEFVDAWNAQGFDALCFVNSNDVVPSYPSWWTKQVGSTRYFDARGRMLVDEPPETREWFRLNWADHHMDNYVRLLGNAAARPAAA
jgi:hypothetical protein